MLPLHWIHAENGTRADIFKFFQNNLEKMQDSMLLNAIFTAFWTHQQRQILIYAFVPYLIYFAVANFYYYQCLLAGVSNEPLGLWSDFCRFFASDDEQCDETNGFEPVFRVLLMLSIL